MNLEQLAQQITDGERRAIARGLTLVESNQEAHEELALKLFGLLGQAPRAARVGITGPPGAGKSTLLERLVLEWVALGEKVAVLTIDPSSRRTGGSLLGDKTRMEQIAHHDRVFVRPSPSGEHLGGLGRRTPLMCSLLERAGYQRIVIETVGVGQSEVAASYLVDVLLLVALPGAGDEVQGLKRGLMEEVDVVAVNKADLGTAKQTVATLRAALRVFRRAVPVMAVSAITGEGVSSLRESLSSVQRQDRVGAELPLFDDFVKEALWRACFARNGHWSELRDKVARGERDFLTVLPEVWQELQRLRQG